MKAISLNVSEFSYGKFRELAKRQGLAVSELIRRAMDEFLERHYENRMSIRELPTFRSGGIRRSLRGGDIFEEMIQR